MFIKCFSFNFKDFYQTSIFDTTQILETQNGYHLEVFIPKQDSFLDSYITYLQNSREALFPHILASFSKLNDFPIYFFAKEVALATFCCSELTSSRNSKNGESVEILYFQSKIFIEYKDLTLY